jgi:Ca2+-binding RTX toxin-like protein
MTPFPAGRATTPCAAATVVTTCGAATATTFWTLQAARSSRTASAISFEPGRGNNTIIGHAGLWAAGEGIDISYGDVFGSGGLVITINADGAGTTVSNVGGVVNDTFTFTHFFIGTEDDDLITRSANDDRWFGFQGGAGNDTIIGNSNGTDYVDYRDDSEFNGGGAVTVDLANETATDGFGDTDTLIDIEQVRGSIFDDSLTGDSEANELDGDDGNDTLNGGDGNDTLIGGGGDDVLNGGAGDDFILPGTGSDQVNGGSGFDTVAYDDGSLSAGINATLLGGGTPTVWTVNEVGGSTDILTDIEAIIGTGFNDTINGGAATIALQLFGGGGDDSITGGAGDDTLAGGNGNDFIDGGDGNDTIYGGFGTDTIVGGTGADTYIDDLSGLSDSQSFNMIVNLSLGQLGPNTLAPEDRNSISQVENYTLIGAVDALVIGGSEDNTFITGAGNDTINGGLGNDSIVGGAGNDSIDGSNGADTIHGGDGIDTILGGLGNDSLFGDGGDDWLDGGSGNDTILGGNGNDQIFGGDGNDLIFGGNGSDTMDGGEGGDVYVVDQFDTITDTGVTGFDRAVTNNASGMSFIMSDWSGVERVNGFTGDDTVDGSGYGQAIFVAASAGNDSIVGTAFDDILLGGDGNDFINGGDGNNLMIGGAGADTYFGGDGNDTIYVEDELDVVLDAGGGFDRVVVAVSTGLSLSVGSWANVERVASLNGNDTIDATGNTVGITLSGGDGQDSLIGGSGADILLGQNGNDYLTGGDGNDSMIGGAGNDTFVGGSGNDLIIAGAGADVFVFEDDWGRDVVLGYDDDLHIFDFTGHSAVTGFDDLQVDQVGANTEITLVAGGADKIVLASVSALVIDATDFAFA